MDAKTLLEKRDFHFNEMKKIVETGKGREPQVLTQQERDDYDFHGDTVRFDYRQLSPRLRNRIWVMFILGR